MVKCVKTALSDLGFTYLKNESSRITEFEVQTPCKFRVLVEDPAGERSTFGLRTVKGDESAIELWRYIGATEPEEVLKTSVNAFLNKLRDVMQREPWEGFGTFRSRTEKARWAELGRI